MREEMQRRRPWLAIGVLAAAAIMICVGVINGEASLVEQKAIRICLECVGIG